MAKPSHLRVVPPGPLSGGDDGGTYNGEMDARVKALEDTMIDVRLALARIEGKLETLATKDDLALLRDRVAKVEGALGGTLGFWQFLFVVGALLAVLLRWPELFRLAGIAAQ